MKNGTKKTVDPSANMVVYYLWIIIDVYSILHIPVLKKEVLSQLNPVFGDVILDATFGFGGHSESLLLQCSECKLVAVDRDPATRTRAAEFATKFAPRFEYHNATFAKYIQSTNTKFNKVLFDFGVSSMQLDSPERGFSFASEGILDMRMSQSGLSAFDIVNTYDESELRDIIYNYGDETAAKIIAAAIVSARQKNAIETTKQLQKIIHEALGRSTVFKKYSHIDTSTKTFQ